MNLREEEIGAILARTSGPPCHRAQSLLVDRVKGALSDEETSLMDRHLAHCSDCSSLEETLEWVLPTLTGMAEVEPEPAWTATVMAATARHQEVRPHTGGWDERLRRLWRRAIWRPQTALQLAYAAAVLVLVLTGGRLPTPSLGQASRLVQDAPGHAAGLLPAVWTEAPIRSAAWGRSAWSSLQQEGTEARDWVARHYVSRRRGLGPVWTDLRTHGGALGSSLRRGELFQAAPSFNNLLVDMGHLWSGLIHPPKEEINQPTGG